ncbi:protein of unknown function [Xenorhabdus poinarii G6]|uniref:Uncharacterized protein n=1 Tax=Xenorhabdus poinarii G6 TaxID=1354304 RepID=A0A068R392_9GAMM|nr:protein of unknown function [Xenorhabdus poinarii G6]
MIRTTHVMCKLLGCPVILAA